MMTKMMEAMINSFSVKEREELLLKLMPGMMKNADIEAMIENTIITVSKQTTIYSILSFLKKMLKKITLYDIGTLIKILSESNIDLKKFMTETKPAMMKKMMPKIMPVMKHVMPKMMGMMSPMMPIMAEHIPTMSSTMIPMLKKNDSVRSNMLTMMQTIFPHCAENMFPLIEQENRLDFIYKLYGIMAKSATQEMNADEKKNFIIGSNNTIKQQFNIKNQ